MRRLLPVLTGAAAVLLCTPPAAGAEGICALLNRSGAAHHSEVTVDGRLFFASNLAMAGAGGCINHRGEPLPGSVLRLDADSSKTRKQLDELRAKAESIRAKGAYPLITAQVKGYFVVDQSPSALFRASLELRRLSDVRIAELPAARSLTPVPICDVLKDPGKFRDQRIAIDAVAVTDSLNGSWLTGACGPPAGHPSLIQPAYPSYVVRGLERSFDAKPAAEAASAQPRRRTVVVGWLRVKDAYTPRCAGDLITRGNGFGPLGLAALRLEAEQTISTASIGAAQAAPFEAEPQRCPAPSN